MKRLPVCEVQLMTEEKHCEEHKRCKNDKHGLIPLTPSQQTDCKKEIQEVYQEGQIFDR